MTLCVSRPALYCWNDPNILGRRRREITTDLEVEATVEKIASSGSGHFWVSSNKHKENITAIQLKWISSDFINNWDDIDFRIITTLARSAGISEMIDTHCKQTDL